MAILLIEYEDWRTPLKNYIAKGILPGNQKEAKKIVQKFSRYVVTKGQLFRRALSTPLLKCIGPSEIVYVLAEVHEGSCGHHIGGMSLATKSLRTRYFSPIMNTDVAQYIKKC
jgi:hypothetical protein